MASTSPTPRARRGRYDRLVLATHADQALRLLEQPTRSDGSGRVPIYLQRRDVLHRLAGHAASAGGLGELELHGEGTGERPVIVGHLLDGTVCRACRAWL